jgi:hypothetical protein
MLMCACHPSYSRKYKIGEQQSRPAQAKARSYLKNNQSKKAGGMAQVIKHLPSKWKTLSSNQELPKKKKNQKIFK